MNKRIAAGSAIETAIVNLAIEYLRKDKDNIIGIYLVPFTIGDHQKIELSIVCTSQLSELKSITKRFNGIDLIATINYWHEYSGLFHEVGDPKYHKLQDLKDGYIVYDPQSMLSNTKEDFCELLEIKSYFNTFDLSNELVKTVKSSIYNGNNKNKQKKKKH